MEKKWTVNMPEDGWDDREVSFYCELCDATIIEKSVYLNLDFLLKMGMTQATLFKELHNNDMHTWNEDTQQWAP